MILILTLANKPALLLDALTSVQAQTRRDFRHIVHLDGGGWPARSYPPSVFFNQHVRAAKTGDYVCWLSDDDLWSPDYLERLAGYMDANPTCAACYGAAEFVTYDPASDAYTYLHTIPAQETYSKHNPPSCKIDGGQVIMAKRLFDLIEPPWMPEGLGDCNISDGSLLNLIAQETDIVPVPSPRPLLQHRMTPESSHWRLVDGHPAFATAETVGRLSR